jgi:uncharacterized protein YgbK (DUF1537 family)
LFARSATDGQVHRIDRHPIMSKHPVTPMSEAHLVLHLGQQTRMPIQSFQAPMFERSPEEIDAELQRLSQDPDLGAVLIDGLTEQHLTQTGRLLERLAQGFKPASLERKPLFCVGGSGVEYALTQWWQAQGRSMQAPTHLDRFAPVEQVLAVSGSASALSASQIDCALQHGFVDLAVDPVTLADGSGIEPLIEQALLGLKAGKSVMLHTSRGPQDPRMRSTDPAGGQGMGRRLGQGLAQVVERVLRQHRLQRLLLSGGDTSSWITQKLKPDALQVVARLDRGAPLCRLLSSEGHLNGLEVALKGGQMGQVDYFVKAMNGKH